MLILDDDQAVRESLVDYFNDQEWRVLSAATAEEALKVLERETAAGAVMDIPAIRHDILDFCVRELVTLSGEGVEKKMAIIVLVKRSWNHRKAT